MVHSTFVSQAEFLDAYDTHADALFRHCFLRLQNREKSKEVLAQAFQNAWMFIAKGNFADSLKILVYREADALIKEAQKNHVPVTEASETEFLKNVPMEYRPLCILRWVDGFTPSEISKIIGGTPAEHLQHLNASLKLLSATSTASNV